MSNGSLSVSRCLKKLEGKCIKSKEVAAGLLYQLASSEETNKDVLFFHAGLIQAMIKTMKTGESIKLKQFAGYIIVQLASKEKYNRPLFLHHPGLLPALVTVIEDKASSTHVKRVAMLTLLAFSTCFENHPGMMAHPPAISVALKVMKQGESVRLQEDAVSLLQNLAFTEKNCRALFLHPGLVPAVLKLLDKGSSLRMKENSLGVLRCLACEAANRRVLFLFPGLVPLLIATIDCPKQPIALKEMAIVTLNNLLEKETKSDMFSHPGFVSAMINTLDKEESVKLKGLAISTLCQFALEPDFCRALYSTPSLVSEMINTVDMTDSPQVEQDARHILRKFTEEAELKRALFILPEFVSIFFHAMENKLSTRGKASIVDLLQSFSKDAKLARELFEFPGLVSTLIHTLKMKDVNDSSRVKEYAANVLLNLVAVNIQNRCDMVSSPNTVHALIYVLNLKNSSCEVKEIIVNVFSSVRVELSQNGIVFFRELIPALIHTMDGTESIPVKTIVANTLRNLVQKTQPALLMPELFTFVTQMLRKWNDEQFVKSLDEAYNRSELGLIGDFVSALVRALEGECAELKLSAVEMVNSLSTAKGNMQGMFRFPSLLPAVLNAIETKNDNDDVKTTAIQVLQNFACEENNRREMVSHPQLIPLLIIELDSGSCIPTKVGIVQTLQRFTSEAESCRALFAHELLVPTLLKIIAGEETSPVVKRISSLVLRDLAVEVQSRHELFFHPGFMAALTTLLEAEQTLELKSYALETLYLMSCEVPSTLFTDHPQLEQKVTRVMEIPSFTSCALLTWINMKCDTECVCLEEIITLVQTRVLDPALGKEGDWTLQHALLAFWQLSKVDVNRLKMFQLGFLPSLLLATSVAIQEQEQEATEFGLHCLRLFASDKDALAYLQQQHSESILDMVFAVESDFTCTKISQELRCALVQTPFPRAMAFEVNLG